MLVRLLLCRSGWIAILLATIFVLPLSAAPVSSVAQIFDLGMGARPLAMGGAFVGLADDGNALYYNPAGLAWLQGLSILSSYETRLGTASYGQVSASMPHLAFGVHYFDFGNVDETDDFGNVVGSFSYRNYTFIAATGAKAADLPFLDGLPFADSIGFGISAKFLKISTLHPGSGTGLALDLPFLLRATMSSSRFPLITSYAAGFVIRNIFGVPIQYESDHVEGWQRNVHAGFSLGIADQVILAVDATSESNFHFGGEWTPIPSVSFRAGLRREGIWLPSLGLGLRYRNFLFDFAGVIHPYLNSQLQGSLSVVW